MTQRLAASPATLILTARGIRSFGDGLISLVLPVYLLELGYSALATGMITTATLLGSATLTLLAGVSAGRAPVKTLLSGAAVLMTLTGVGFATIGNFWPLVLIAFVGTLNPSSGDVSVFLPLEQAELAGVVSKRDRTRQFARYSFIGSVLAAIGALAAGLPERTADFFWYRSKVRAARCLSGLRGPWTNCPRNLPKPPRNRRAGRLSTKFSARSISTNRPWAGGAV